MTGDHSTFRPARRHRDWRAGVSVTALGAAALGAAMLAAAPAGAIVVRDDVGAANARDVNNLWPAVGQVVTWFPSGGVGLCTGTYINPRVVISAAHCFADTAGDEELLAGDGLVVSFTTQNFTLPHLLAFRSGGFQTTDTVVRATDIVVHEDYLSFPRADVAFMAFDTPRLGPTMSLMLSPIAEGTTATIIGYGRNGIGSLGDVGGIDWWRRVARNTLSADISFDDLLGSDEGLPYAWYWTDFDEPGNPDTDFWGDGGPLPDEGTTAPGDSGGPLVVNIAGRDVVGGVLSGGFAVGTVSNGWGDVSFWQALYDYAGWLTVNNPYKYATAKTGGGSWTDPGHWVQMLDPAYLMTRTNAQGDLELVNMLPQLDVSAPLSGPGSTGFVPNNTDGAPSGDVNVAGAPARYFDVTLSAGGTTTLDAAIEIDRLTIAGRGTGLTIETGGSLTSLLDVAMAAGRLRIDGTLASPLIGMAGGQLTGAGRIETDVLFVDGGLVSAGTVGTVGTLTVDGDMGMSPDAVLFVDTIRGAADQLAVSGMVIVDGHLVFNKGLGAAPRHGESYAIVTAGDGLAGAFDKVSTLQGVLQPSLTYTGDAVIAELRAGAFVDLLTGADPTRLAFAQALDDLRGSSYASLYDLYGEMDWMDGGSLGTLFDNLSPAGMTGALSLFEAQGNAFTDLFSGRLALLGSPGGAQGISVMGDIRQVLALGGDAGFGVDQRQARLAGFGTSGFGGGMGFTGPVPGGAGTMTLPDGMSGFVSGGYQEQRRSNAVGLTATSDHHGDRSWHMAMGLEQKRSERLTLGFATSFASGESAYGVQAYNRAETSSLQSAFYGAYRFDGGAYVAALASAGVTTADSRRQFGAGELPYDVTGGFNGNTVATMVETGVNLALGRGLTLTPKAGLRNSWLSTGALEERGGDAALFVEARTVSRMEARMGMGISGAVAFDSGWTFTPNLEAAYVHNLSGQDADICVRFAAVEMEAFALPAALRDSGWGEVRGGMRLERGALSFGLDLSTDLGRSDLHEDKARASVGYRF